VGPVAVAASAFAAGFAVAASPGAVSLLSLRWGLQRGAMTCLLVGLGAATADALYMALALVGVLPLLAAAGWLSTILLLVGGMVLLILGLHAVRSGVALSDESAESPVRGAAEGRTPYLVGLTVTLMNPMTIAAWLAIAGGLLASVELGQGAVEFGLMGGLVLGAIFAGSAAWFAILAVLVAVLRARIDARYLRLASAGTGLVLIGLGCLLVVRGGLDITG
jgi:threonine/homoserine/homoserine lactone efflux protein